MKIEKSVHWVVEMDDNSYTRYSPTNWTIRMGESDEPVYACVELEKLFQEHYEKITQGS